MEGESTFTYDATTYTATINNASAKLGVGDFNTGSPLYLGHFKSNQANNAYVLIQADDDPRIAGVLFKTEDTDTDVRIKGALFFDNSASDPFGRGILKLAINNSASNTNVSVSDVVLGIAATQITAYQNFSMNANTLDMAGGLIDTNGGSIDTGGGNVQTNGGNIDLTSGGNIDGNGTNDLNNFNNITANSKSFDIEHPTKKLPWRIEYGVLEGPEHGVFFRGQATENVIELPDYWTDLVHEDSYTVQLTPIGGPCVHWVEKIEDNKVYINCQDGKPNCYFTINATRKDVNPPKLEYIKE